MSDSKVTALPSAGALDGTEVTYIVQSNASVKTTTQDIADLASGSSASGVAGSVQFSDGTTLSSDASNLFWDDTNNRLGIGTATPSGPLHVVDGTYEMYSNGHWFELTSSSGSAKGIRITQGTPGVTEGTTLISAESGGIYKFKIAQKDGAPKMTVIVAGTGVGNVGIGTDSPSALLDVSGAIKCGSYTVATVPSASANGAGAQVYVSDETGGAVIAFSDGTNWRRVTDRAIIA